MATINADNLPQEDAPTADARTMVVNDLAGATELVLGPAALALTGGSMSGALDVPSLVVDGGPLIAGGTFQAVGDATVGTLTASGDITVANSSNAHIELNDTSGSADQHRYRLNVNNVAFVVEGLSDAGVVDSFLRIRPGDTTFQKAHPIVMTAATSVSVPTPTASGHALRWDSAAEVKSLKAMGVVTVESGSPTLDFVEADQAADATTFKINMINGLLFFRAMDDAGVEQAQALRLSRDGAVRLAGSGGVVDASLASAVTVPDATADGEALAYGQNGAALQRLTMQGENYPSVSLKPDIAGYLNFQDSGGAARHQFEYNQNNGVWQWIQRDDANAFERSLILAREDGDLVLTGATSVEMPAPAAAGHAVRVAAWEASTGRYAVEGPNGLLEQGDTEWRDIWASAVDADITAGYAEVRRVGNTVSVNFEGKNNTGAALDVQDFLTLPVGFRPSNTTNRWPMFEALDLSSTGGNVHPCYSNSSTGAFRKWAGWSAGYQLAMNITFLTDDSFPAVLPGVPA